MENLSKIVRFIDTYLNISDIDDSSYNGLQFEAKENVKKIVCAVTAGAETFAVAAKRKADMLIVHHGLFWKYVDPRIQSANKKRFSILEKNGISLYAAHLPLDLHPVIGNNAQLLKLIGAAKDRPFGRYNGRDIAYQGTFKKPKNLDDILSTLSSKLGAVCTVLPFGPKKVRTVAAVSGGAGRAPLAEAIQKGVELYISGESIEIYHDARDYGINVVFAGHHATETLGVKALAALLNRRMNVRAEFVDIPTGL
jgi:dinuclear metal center YbgI/SA1388 family protein